MDNSILLSIIKRFILVNMCFVKLILLAGGTIIYRFFKSHQMGLWKVLFCYNNSESNQGLIISHSLSNYHLIIIFNYHLFIILLSFIYHI